MIARITDYLSPQSGTRLLVVSYFIAMSVGLIGAGSMSNFLLPLMTAEMSDVTMRGVVLVLAAMVLFGVFRRAAALVLSLVVFYTSYLALYAGGDVGAFWGDLALIGALLMTADLARMQEAEDAWDDDEPTATSQHTEPKTPGPSHSRNDNPFRKDFDIARAG